MTLSTVTLKFPPDSFQEVNILAYNTVLVHVTLSLLRQEPPQANPSSMVMDNEAIL